MLLWNLSNYINREFPNALYVSSKTDVYAAVSAISSGKYTYNLFPLPCKS